MEHESAPLIVLKELAGNPPPQLNAVQTFLAPYAELLMIFWISAWIMTAIILLLKLRHEYVLHRKNKGLL